MKLRILCLLAAIALVLPSVSACAPHVHSYGDAWSYNETHHYKRATCEHSELMTDEGEHTPEDGVCTVCGYRIPTEGPPEETPGNAPEDTPETTPEDTPGDTPEDTPGDTPGDEPGDTPEDEPGDTPGDGPERVPECTPDVGHSFSDRVCTVCGALAPSEGLAFKELPYGDGYYVDGVGTCRDAHIVIPATYEGKPVLSIAVGAFTDCDFVDTVAVPESVIYMGFSTNGVPDPTFAGHITVLCEAKERPEDWAERWNPSFCPVIWEYKSNDIAEDGCAYVTVNGLKYGVNIEEGTAFLIKQPSTVAGDIVIPESFSYKGRTVTVTKLRMSAFANCLSLTSVRIGDSVTEVEFSAFVNCPALTVYCAAPAKPDGWNKNWNMSPNCPIVWDCDNTDVATDGMAYTVVDGVRYGIKDGFAIVRQQPKNLVSVVLPATVTYRGVAYPVEEIEMLAFDSCALLERIVIGRSVVRMGASVFSGCRALSIYCEAEEKPAGWPTGWNYENFPVVWGHTGD